MRLNGALKATQGCEAGLKVPEPCGEPGRTYLAMCVHEHLPAGRALVICAEHVSGPWYCNQCRDVDGHLCPVTFTELAAT